MFIDARIPVSLGSSDLTDAAVLTERGPVPHGAVGRIFDQSLAAHVPGCGCCGGRSPAAMALAELFTDRARGTVPFFKSVRVSDVSDAGRDAVLDALSNDPVVAARFRLVS